MPTSRRAFLEDVSFATLIAGFPEPARAALSRYAEKPPEPLFPKALKKGDTVALVRPASPSFEYEMNEIGAEIVATLGFVPKLTANAGRKYGYLAGTDAERAADLNAAFADPNVGAVWCLSGGYGTSRLLPYLDYETIRKNPKPFIGYSDITGTLNAIHRLTGLVTFHGPVAESTLSDYSLTAFRKVVMEGASGRIAEPPPFTPREGTVDAENRVWKLAGLSGVALGKFEDCDPSRDRGTTLLGSWSWQEVCADRLGKLGIPVLAGLCFGHIRDKATLPVGVMAELDADAGTLTLLEPAVR